MNFILHPQLEADTLFIRDLDLSRLLLMNDARLPWFILVPRKPIVQEIFELEVQDQQVLLQEISWVAEWIKKTFNADKMNIAALGNVVPQLHIHIIARFKTDFAWPKPVWGVGTKELYSKEQIMKIMDQITE